MFKKFGEMNNPNQAVKVQATEKVVGTLYYRVGKNETEANFLDWFRSWKDYKITEFEAKYREALREIERIEYNMEKQLPDVENRPLLLVSKDYRVPTSEEIALLVAEKDELKRKYLERYFFGMMAMSQAMINAAVKTQNENKKKQRDEIISKDGDARKTMISTIFGTVLTDMSIDSRQHVISWKRATPTDPLTNPKAALTADDIEEAYNKQDWLFVFEATMATHLQVDAVVMKLQCSKDKKSNLRS